MVGLDGQGLVKKIVKTKRTRPNGEIISNGFDRKGRNTLAE